MILFLTGIGKVYIWYNDYHNSYYINIVCVYFSPLSHFYLTMRDTLINAYPDIIVINLYTTCVWHSMH